MREVKMRISSVLSRLNCCFRQTRQNEIAERVREKQTQITLAKLESIAITDKKGTPNPLLFPHIEMALLNATTNNNQGDSQNPTRQPT